MTRIMSTGDLEPSITFVLSATTDDNVPIPVNVTGYPVRILGTRGDTLVIDREPDNIAIVGNTSVLTLDWQDGETDLPGRIQFEIEVTWVPGSRPQTFVTNEDVKLREDADYRNLGDPPADPTVVGADTYVNTVLQLEGDAWETITDYIDTFATTAPVSTPQSLAINQRVHKETLDAPTYFPESSPNNWDPARNAYNWKASNTRKLRAGLGRAAVLGFQCELVIIGTSQGAFSIDDALVSNELKAWPLYMREEIARHGVTISGTGYVRFADGAVAADSRWTTSGVWSAPSPSFGVTVTNGAFATFTTDKAGDRTTVYYYDDASGATFTISVNGASSGAGFTTVTASGPAGWKKVTLSAAIAASQTVRVTKASGGVIYLAGACIWNNAGGLLVHNLSQSGSTAKGTGTGAWEAASTTSHLGQVFAQAQPLAQLLVPDAVIIALGVNDKATSSGTDAEIRTAITNIRNRYPNSDCILGTGTPLADTTVSATVWETYVGGLYGLADTLDVPLIDFTHRLGRWSVLSGNGLNGDMVGHLRDEAAADLGRSLGQLLVT